MATTLYYGDNFEVLREHVADASVDPIYLDPPFNSNASYPQATCSQTAARPSRPAFVSAK